MPPIQDHPLRYQLTNELHARPFPTMTCPCTVVYLAVKQPQEAVHRDRMQDMQHLIQLLDRHGAPHPQPGATHHTAQIGRHMVKWEQHTEFVSYTVYYDGVSARAFDPADFDVFPADWLAEAPGQRITSALIRVVPRTEPDQLKAALHDWFVPESLAVSQVLDDSAVVAGDFRIDPAGHVRFAIFPNPGTGSQRVGRVVQRLCEIETYRAMSMLGFSRARGLTPVIGKLDTRLSEMMAEMTTGTKPAEEILTQLLAVSAELEAKAAQSAFRFGATGAYDALVSQRISLVARGTPRGLPDICRIHAAAVRAGHAHGELHREAAGYPRQPERAGQGELLRTRVDVERSAQNQALLASMDRRADIALRLQHTVEGLSVVAVSYYAVGAGLRLSVPAGRTLRDVPEGADRRRYPAGDRAGLAGHPADPAQAALSRSAQVQKERAARRGGPLSFLRIPLSGPGSADPARRAGHRPGSSRSAPSARSPCRARTPAQDTAADSRWHQTADAPRSGNPAGSRGRGRRATTFGDDRGGDAQGGRDHDR